MVVLVLALLFNFAAGSCPPLKVDGTHVAHDGRDRCTYIRQRLPRPNTWKDAKGMCQGVSLSPHRWHLPKLISDSDEDWLAVAIRRKARVDDWKIWIDLRRDAATAAEMENLTKWLDSSKWRWTRDNVTLKASYIGTVPWRNGLPENRTISNGHDTMSQYCVTAEKIKATPKVVWRVRQCGQDLSELVNPVSNVRIDQLVCETRADYFPTTVTNSTEAATDEWMWLLAAITGVFVLVMLSIVILTCCMIKRRRGARSSLGESSRTTASGSRSIISDRRTAPKANEKPTDSTVQGTSSGGNTDDVRYAKAKGRKPTSISSRDSTTSAPAKLRRYEHLLKGSAAKKRKSRHPSAQRDLNRRK